MRYHGLLVLALIAAAGCDDRTQAVPLLTAPPALASSGVRAYVVQEPGGTPDRVTLTIHVESMDVPVAAYQGQLQFDADAMQIIDATTPSDGNRIVNAASAGPGVVKFAGFSTDAFAHTAAVQIIVRPLKSIEDAHLLATLDVVGEVAGIAVARDRIIQQRGIFSKAAGSTTAK